MNAPEPLMVIIVGPASMQNKLLAKLVVERTGYACEVRAPERLNGNVGAATLALVDAGESARVRALCASGLFTSIALINAHADSWAEDFIAYPGVKGVFGCDASEDELVKGIQAIFDGEYWLARRALWAHLERTRRLPQPAVSPPAGALTRKEVETLRLLATGKTTDHIANALKVSPHTVKTHIYNLFRKLRVSNRLQAAHWAARHLFSAEPPPR